jgi:hypothetical protein
LILLFLLASLAGTLAALLVDGRSSPASVHQPEQNQSSAVAGGSLHMPSKLEDD